jgi:hypothetical protein
VIAEGWGQRLQAGCPPSDFEKVVETTVNSIADALHLISVKEPILTALPVISMDGI